MRTPIKVVFAILALWSCICPGPAFAIIAMDTDVTFRSNVTTGNCELIITEDEEFSHINSHCNLEKNGFLVFGWDLTNHNLGWPRSDVVRRYWGVADFFGGVPDVSSEYCVKFGEPFGTYPLTVYFGNPFDSDLNIETPGHSTCDTPEPQVKAYYQLQCFGAFVWVFSVDALIPGVHLSYRLESDPIFCWAVAVIGGT